jgi:hypothetical protein
MITPQITPQRHESNPYEWNSTSNRDRPSRPDSQDLSTSAFSQNPNSGHPRTAAQYQHGGAIAGVPQFTSLALGLRSEHY